MNNSEKGEEIFETNPTSDGSAASNLAFYKDSLVEKPDRSEHDQLIETHINAEDSFQVFNGKLFGKSQYEYSIADAIERRAENPLHRFARLKGELDTLKTDLDAMVAADKVGVSSIWSALQVETGKLVESARGLGEHKALALAAPSATSTDRELQRLLDSINRKPSEGGLKGSAPGASSSSLSLSGMASGSAGTKNTGGGRGDAELLAMEQRVAALETLLGHASNVADTNAAAGGAAANFPILETLSRLEQRVSMLDAENLEELRVRATTLRQELESTTKSKSGISSEQKAIEAAKKVDDLFEQIQKVEAVAGDLPTLVIRLKTLENIHLAASQFASRLASMETEVKNVTGDLKSNKEVIASLKAGLAENISIMQQNVKMVDKKLASK